jgi:uncharacterized protein YraI
MKRLAVFSAIILAMGLGLAATAAQARTVVITNNLNVRTGPGTQYQVIGVLPAGAQAWIGSCSGNWCNVNFNGLRGWSSASYLAPGYRPPPVVVVPPVYRPPYYGGYRPPYYRPPYYRPGGCKIAPGYPCR